MQLRKAIEKAKERDRDRKGIPERETPAPRRIVQDDACTMPMYTETAHIPAKPDDLHNMRCICAGPLCMEMDAYKVLRTKVNHLSAEKGWKTLLITSPRPSEGKTLTAVNLAISISHAHDQTVLLVDCDLRRQSVHKTFGVESPYGLGNHFDDDVPLQDLFVWPGIEKLTFISGGKTVASNSAEILGSEKMKRLVDELKFRYPDRFVLFDAPAILGPADTLALMPFVDCILMVVEERKSRMKDVLKALEVIPKEKFLGFVANRQKSSAKQNGYYKEY